MGIIRCEKGLHFYDNVKYDKCPYCEQRKQQIQKNTNIMQEQKTVAVQAEKLSELEEYICRQEKEKIEANDYRSEEHTSDSSHVSESRMPSSA